MGSAESQHEPLIEYLEETQSALEAQVKATGNLSPPLLDLI